MLRRFGEGINRIAISISRQTNNCCDWDDHGSFAIRASRDAFQVRGGCTLIEALHGIESGMIYGKTHIRGFPDLKEIYVVIKSNVFPVKPRSNHLHSELRPATYQGLDDTERNMVNVELNSELTDCQTLGGPRLAGRPSWGGNKMPVVRLTHLADVSFGSAYDGCSSVDLDKDRAVKLIK
jgi:hypothetical protein